jgi:hypothetical protein
METDLHRLFVIPRDLENLNVTYLGLAKHSDRDLQPA